MSNNTWMGIAKSLPVIGGVVSALSSIGADGRQLKQQKELTKIQEESATRLAERQKGLALDMWNQTNVGALRKHYEEAGLNPYSIGESGGMTGQSSGISTPIPTGGTAATGAQNEANKLQTGMALANLGLIAAQTKKTEAEAVKIAGADTANTTANTAATTWQTAMNEALGQYTRDSARADSIFKGAEADMLNTKWRRFEEAQGDQRSEGYKSYMGALKAEWDEAITKAQNAKKTGNILEAQAAIEGFKQDMADSGLSPETPWYYKLLMEMATRLGVNPMKK